MLKTSKFFSGLLLELTIGVIFSAPVFAGETGSEYRSYGIVEFKADTDSLDPLDPENPNPEKPVVPIDPTSPEKPVAPKTNGPLTIDFASSFDFGLNKITNKNEIYFARAQKYADGHRDTPNYVQISDNRGTNAGWMLTVKQNGQLAAVEKTLHQELTGAQIILDKPTVKSSSTEPVKPIAHQPIILNPDGAASLVMSAAVNSGAGTWENYWGRVEKITEKTPDGREKNVNVTKAVSLKVPGATPKDAVRYQTVLNWELTDTPAN